MDGAKMSLLFGPAPDPALDPEDPDDRATLVQGGAGGRLSADRLALREVLATQIVGEDPPQVWATAQRLLALGLDREDVLRQLSMALAVVMSEALNEERSPDRSDYHGALGALPLPPVEEMESVLVGTIVHQPGMALDEAVNAALGTLGRAADDELAGGLMMRIAERLSDGDDQPLCRLPGDRSVHVGDLTEGIVLTHRLSPPERDTATLNLDFDLIGFARRRRLRLPGGGDLALVSSGHGQMTWVGPARWLDAYPAGALLTVRVGGHGLVGLGLLTSPPDADDGLVGRVRAEYEAGLGAAGLPVCGEDLLLGLQMEDRSTFAAPRPPLEELCAAAGLQRRGHEVAHGEQVWAEARRVGRMWQVVDLIEPGDGRLAALAALRAADEGDDDPDRLRAAMGGLTHPDVLDVVADLVLGLDDDAELLARAADFGRRLVAAAKGPAEVAVAHWWSAVVAERGGEPVAAEGHLKLAEAADPEWLPAVDRLAWYASDRGDAPTAVGLWRRLGLDRTIDTDLQVVEPFIAAPHPELGRHDPCWCGSSRKYKQCHLDRAVPVPLPERCGWLWRKAVAFVERRGGAPGPELLSLGRILAGEPGDPERLAAALADPLVADVGLVEGGWFARFLTERGPLLPDDEAQLAAAWQLVPRAVYEVVASGPGGMSLHDLGTGEDLDVRLGRSLGPARVVCGRAVPDGETRQLVGAVFPVASGTETDLVRLCHEGLGPQLCAYAARPTSAGPARV